MQLGPRRTQSSQCAVPRSDFWPIFGPSPDEQIADFRGIDARQFGAEPVAVLAAVLEQVPNAAQRPPVGVYDTRPVTTISIGAWVLNNVPDNCNPEARCQVAVLEKTSP
jgi:hypothetical protein